MKNKKHLFARRYSECFERVLSGFGAILALVFLSGGGAYAATPTIDRLNPLSTTPNQGFTAQATGNNNIDERVRQLAEQLPQLLDAQTLNSNVLSQLAPRQRKAAATLMEQTGGTDLRIRVRQGVGAIRYLKVSDSGKKLKQAQSLLPAGSDRDKQTAADFLQENHELLNIAEPAQEFVLQRREVVDSLGHASLRYRQQFQGIPIWPSEAQVHLDQDGNVDLFEGAYIPTPSRVSLEPQITANEARKKARRAVPDATAANVGEAELVIYALDDSAPRLAWKIEVEVSLSQRWLVVIDALDGSVITAFNQVADVNIKGSGVDLYGVKRTLNVWQDKQTFWMVDTSKKMFDPTTNPLNTDSLRGGIVILDAENNSPDNNGSLHLKSVISANANSWSPRDAVSASYGLSKTYDYFLSQHQRNSIDGKGGSLLGVVRFQKDYNNAFWNGTLMAFGDGLPFARALDVVGHELTHGVTEHTAGLVYKNQSGAMNEAFSDIFGIAVENFTNKKIDWIQGDGLGDRTYSRDFKNPASRSIPGTNIPYPTKFSEFISTQQDNGGVHINSGIINHAFYMLAEGLNGAIGTKDAEKIFYRALSKHLVANSQFVDTRLACVQSAGELFGANSAQAKATAKAFDAVEIFDDAGTPQDPSTRPPVNGKDATLFVFLFQGQFYLGRREGNDPSTGVALSSIPLIPRRPVISGNGNAAIFVSADHDLCAVATDGSEPAQCLGFAGFIHSVAMTPDGNRWAFVLRDKLGNPTHEITVLDLKANTRKSYELVAPANDGEGNPIDYADSMDFSADGRTLIYDALTYINQSGIGQVPVWAMYALDLRNQIFTSLLPPIPGVAVGNPSFSQTSDSILAFEASNEQTGETAVFAGNLLSGKAALIGKSAQCCALPGYNGDDSAIIYGRYDASQAIGFSLVRQAVGSNWLTPSGNASAWLKNSYAGSIYRRGAFAAPKANVIVKPTVLAFGTASGLKSTVTVVNQGSASMSLGDVALTPIKSQFSISKNSCTGVSLVPSGKCLVEVSFGGGAGLISANLKIPQVETSKSLTVKLSGGIKLQVAKATLTFDPTATNKDQLLVNGQLSGAKNVSPATIKSMAFSLGGFKQVLTRFTKVNGQLKFQSTKAGITNLTIDLIKGTFSINASRLNLGKLSNPPQVSLTLNSTMDCTKPKFKTQTGKWTFDKAAGQIQTSCTVLRK